MNREEFSIKNSIIKPELKTEEKKDNSIKILENIPKPNPNQNILNENDFGRSQNNFEKNKMNLLQAIDVNNKKISDKMNQYSYIITYKKYIFLMKRK